MPSRQRGGRASAESVDGAGGRAAERARKRRLSEKRLLFKRFLDARGEKILSKIVELNGIEPSAS
jgi:hypothetical protein